ncbi:MAG TPA: hypothetical protein VKY90_10525 [Candidatus Dormibacteraeota bacterium]|nr:hypothetical protein [Candidatus Dormibacteraeota bacterium]
MPWLEEQLEPLRASARTVAVVLDPDHAVSARDLELLGAVAEAADWWSLRRVYEHQGRRRPSDDPKLLILVHSADYRQPRDLPFDIERACDVICIRPSQAGGP